MDSLESGLACCICLQETPNLVELFPCHHKNVCSTCACRLETKLCPTCRVEVDFVGLNFDSTTKDCKKSESFSYPTAFVGIPLNLILEYRLKTIRKLVASTFQVCFVGSSGIPLHKISSQVFGEFTRKIDTKSDLEERQNCDNVERTRSFEDSFISQSKSDDGGDSMEYLLELFFDTSECTRHYFPNAFVNGRSLRFNCFAFWEFLRILRSTEVADGILPDFVVTCIDSRNEKCIQETVKMQEIMTGVYKLHRRKLYNIWLDVSGSKFKEEKTKSQFRKTLHSMTQVDLPCRIFALPKSLSKNDSTYLVDVIVQMRVQSRKEFTLE